VLINGETDPNQMCQFMTNCVTGQKIISADFKSFVYQCTQCYQASAANPIVLAWNPYYGKTATNVTGDANKDSSNQCVPNTASYITGLVNRCTVYALPASRGTVPYLSTSLNAFGCI